MKYAEWFWIIFVVATIFGGFWGWSNRRYVGIGIVAWILFLLIGLFVFGSPVKG